MNPHARRRMTRRVLCMLILAVVGLSAASAIGVPTARALVPTPIHDDLPLTPPPLPPLPATGETAPPADAIADPIEPTAVCGSWHLTSNYGGEWRSSSTWWEYSCKSAYPECLGACNADFPASIWDDFFYWDGTKAVFYGQLFSDLYWPYMMGMEGSYFWWDESTSGWYRFPGYPMGPPNDPPTASFTYTCSGLSCTFDGSSSFDPDGVIYSSGYFWESGNMADAGGRETFHHTYTQPGTYDVTLRVTDTRGGSGSVSRSVTVP